LDVLICRDSSKLFVLCIYLLEVLEIGQEKNRSPSAKP
jgi:hypothetical protein